MVSAEEPGAITKLFVHVQNCPDVGRAAPPLGAVSGAHWRSGA